MDKFNELKEFISTIGFNDEKDTIYILEDGFPVKTYDIHPDIVDLFFKIAEILNK